MSEETGKLNALTGEAADKIADTTDWKAKYEEAEKALASARVDQGRVKKLNEEKAELQRQLDEANARMGDEIPEAIRENFTEEAVKGLAEMRKADRDALARAEATHKAELDALKAQMAEQSARGAAAARTAFEARVNASFPGFLASIGDGGDKAEAWRNYQRFNAASIAAAVNACDFDTLSYHVGKFYRDELGLEPPSGGSGAAAPDPSAIGGGTPATHRQGRIYTEQDILDLYDKENEAHLRGDFAEAKRINGEIKTALREGRVK